MQTASNSLFYKLFDAKHTEHNNDYRPPWQLVLFGALSPQPRNNRVFVWNWLQANQKA